VSVTVPSLLPTTAEATPATASITLIGRHFGIYHQSQRSVQLETLRHAPSRRVQGEGATMRHSGGAKKAQDGAGKPWDGAEKPWDGAGKPRGGEQHKGDAGIGTGTGARADTSSDEAEEGLAAEIWGRSRRKTRVQGMSAQATVLPSDATALQSDATALRSDATALRSDATALRGMEVAEDLVWVSDSVMTCRSPGAGVGSELKVLVTVDGGVGGGVYA
jgi:hypothetical protein